MCPPNFAIKISNIPFNLNEVLYKIWKVFQYPRLITNAFMRYGGHTVITFISWVSLHRAGHSQSATHQSGTDKQPDQVMSCWSFSGLLTIRFQLL